MLTQKGKNSPLFILTSRGDLV